jgi:hypothetical protein
MLCFDDPGAFIMTSHVTVVRIADAMLWLELADRRVLGTPLTHYPDLFNASPDEREKWVVRGDAVCWDNLGLTLSLPALFALS